MEEEKLLLQTDFVLKIPNIIIIPSLDELQIHFNKVMDSLFETHKTVTMWGQKSSRDEETDTGI